MSIAVESPLEMVAIHEETWPDTRARFERMIERHEPVVFRGLAATWLPADTTSELRMLDWLEQLVGHRTVPISIGLPGDAGFVGTARVDRGRSVPTTFSGQRPFPAVADEMRRELQSRTGHALYMQSVEVGKVLPELLPYLKLGLDDCPYTGHWRAWIGTGDHRVNVHYDGDENFFCMLAGRKRFSIAPFDAIADLYVGPLDGPFGPPASLVDPLRPDLTRFPRFANLERQWSVVELEPGDVLYLPAHWWHYVESFGFNVAANYWWSDIPQYQKAEGDIHFLNALLSTRSLPRHWREFWEGMFHQFVFRTTADPYEHLEPSKQGWAGAATPDRLDHIRRLVDGLEQDRWTHGAKTGELPSGQFKVAPMLRMRIESQDSVVLRASEFGKEIPAGFQIVAILAQFAQPKSPTEVLDTMRTAGLHDQDGRIGAAIRDLIANRVLVPCN